MKLTQTQVRRTLNKWRKRLSIDPKWDIDIAINATEGDTDEDNRDCYGHIQTVQANYTALLTVNAWKIDTKEELENTICHETVHLIVDPVWTALMCAFGDRFEEMGRNMLEQVVEQFTRALVTADSQTSKASRARTR